MVCAGHVLDVLPVPTCILCTSPYRVANLESPFVCASTQVCFSELVDETLATPCYTHCEVAFLWVVSHEVGPDCAVLSHSPAIISLSWDFPLFLWLGVKMRSYQNTLFQCSSGRRMGFFSDPSFDTLWLLPFMKLI